MSIDRKYFPALKISQFNPMKDKDGVLVPGWIAKDADLYTVLHSFRDGVYAPAVKAIRTEKNKDERNRLKQSNLPAFTFSCSFKAKDHRKTENIEKKTNLLVIDIDEAGAAAHIRAEHLKGDTSYGIERIRERMIENPWVIFSGLSASGNGVCVVLRIQEDQHEDAFNDIQMRFRERYGIEIDKACRDYVRLRFATYDPDSHIRYWDDATIYQIRKEYWHHKAYIAEQKRALSERKIVLSSNSDKGEYVLEMACDMINKAVEGERHNKIRSAARLLGGYVASNIIDEDHAREALITTVEASSYDDVPDAIKAIDWGMQNGKLSPLDINIITPEDANFGFYMEQDEARQIEIKNLYKKLHAFIRKGTSITLINYEELANDHFVDVTRIKQIAEDLYKRFAHEFNVDNKPVISQVEAYLTGKYDLRRDVIQGNIEGRRKGDTLWSVMRYENIWRDLQMHGFKFKFDDLIRLLRSEYVPDINLWEEHFKFISRNPIKGDPINDLANHVSCTDPTEQPYFNFMFKKMLVRTIKCALDDNYANRFVFVFVSQTQSNGKSWFIRWLNPFGSHKYYAENPLEDNKDSRIRLSETFIYNLEELASINKYELNRLKATISQVGTRDRTPYSRQAENIVRRCSFFGSTNNMTFLVDDVNTRWLCFDISHIDWSYTTKINKDDVWAQAYKLYIEGFDCELDKREQETRDEKNVKFRVDTSENELVERYFQPASKDTQNSVFLTATSIHERISSLTKESRIHLNFVSLGKSLPRLGFKRIRYRGVYGYWCIAINQTPFQQQETKRLDLDSTETEDIPF